MSRSLWNSCKQRIHLKKDWNPFLRTNLEIARLGPWKSSVILTNTEQCQRTKILSITATSQSRAWCGRDGLLFTTTNSGIPHTSVKEIKLLLSGTIPKTQKLFSRNAVTVGSNRNLTSHRNKSRRLQNNDHIYDDLKIFIIIIIWWCLFR